LGYPTIEEEPTMKRTNIYLGEVQHKRLKVMGKKMGLKVSEIIRRMIDEGLKKHEKKARR
jgi:macrodomain Ter protein organizer (MatP/YcbG family)